MGSWFGCKLYWFYCLFYKLVGPVFKISHTQWMHRHQTYENLEYTHQLNISEYTWHIFNNFGFLLSVLGSLNYHCVTTKRIISLHYIPISVCYCILLFWSRLSRLVYYSRVSHGYWTAHSGLLLKSYLTGFVFFCFISFLTNWVPK